MTNPAVLAARLSGRPILMRPSDAEAYARQLVSHFGGERRTGFSGLLAAARRAAFGDENERREAIAAAQEAEPACYYPQWLERTEGAPDGAGFGWTLKNGVALIDVSGPLLEQGFYDWWSGDWIAGYDTLSETVAEVAADERVKGVFVHYDTPGGVAGPGLPALSAQFRALRAQKPVWGWANTAASAGYWLLASNGRAIAPGLGVVGSIGAVITHCSFAGALEKDGIEVTHIIFGPKKVDGSPYAPLSASAKADWQAEIDDLGNLFVANVIAGRVGLTDDAVRGTEAACFYAEASDPDRSGLALGLVDAVMDEAEAFAELAALAAAPIASIFPLSTPNAAKDTPAMATEAETAEIVTKIETRITAIGVKAAERAAKLPALRADPAKLPEAHAILASIGRASLRQAELRARVERIQAAAPEAGDDDDDEVDDDDMDADESGADQTLDPADDDPDAEKNKPTVNDAEAIAESEAAKTHPTLALKAIKAGLTLVQFQDMAEAAGPAQRGHGALAEYMANAKRLGMDAPRADARSGSSPFFEAAVADAKAKAAAAQAAR